MARKKQELQLQSEIETTEEWEEMLQKEGLWVVDVYQEWSGPCAALVGSFRRLKNELGDDLLHFAIAKADSVDPLDKYRGRCEPCFLFFAGGSLVAYVHGANAPVILRTVTEQLGQEHKVMDGTAERKEVKDPRIAVLEEREREQQEEEDHEREEEEKKGFTVALIKPDAVKNGKVEEIMQQMTDAGIEILANEERTLTEAEAREFYKHLEEEEYYEDLVAFMSSGPSFALVLTKGSQGDTILQEWREMIGPTTVDDAKEQAPDSMRAKYGTDRCMNALHGSDSPETAAREMAFFFPNLAVPTVPRPGTQPRVQRTLALIRPDAFRTSKDEILEKIHDAGFKVALQKEMTLSKEQAEEFYKEHKEKDYFDELTTRMSSGPLLALGLARDDAVAGWKEMLGPTVDAKEQAPDSIGAQFAITDTSLNQLHGSDDPETAEKELQYFFPMEQTVAAIKPDAIGTKDDIVAKIHEAGFRIAARKETTISQDIAEEFYSEHKDKEYFNELVEHMCSGPTMFMVLSREDAVKGWREVIGPTDPEQAKAEHPDTLRAHFGQSLLMNAVHGSSNPDHAKQSIEKVFGHLEFNPDGTVKEEKPAEEAQEKAVMDEGGMEANEVAPEFRDDDDQVEEGQTKQTTEDQTQQEDGTPEQKETEAETEQKEGGEDAETKEQKDEEEGGTTKSESTPEESQKQEGETKAESPKPDEQQADDQGESKGEEEQQKGEGQEEEKEQQQEQQEQQQEQEEESTKKEEGESSEQAEAKGEEQKDEEQKEEEKKDEGETKTEEPAQEEQKGEEAKEEETKTEEAKTEEAKGDDSKAEEEEQKSESAKDDATKSEDGEKKEEQKTDEEQATKS